MKKLYFIYIVVLCLFTSCEKSVTEIIKDAEASSFIIYTYDEFGAPMGSGSGFFIDKKGIGVTNYHVLDGSVKAIIKLVDETEYEIDQVLSSDRKSDLVEFTIKNSNNKTFNHVDFSPKMPEKGETVYCVSCPVGLESSASDGIVSSYREDRHGKIVQVTVPISQGSSGSALLNKDGEIFAVSTFKDKSGESLNFGVCFDKEKYELLKTKNDFDKRNLKFNKKENFIILNIPSNKDSDIVLNAIEFKKDVTIAYMSYTNLDISKNEDYIWCEIEGDNRFYILDIDNNKKYYITSSTIGDEGTKVKLASNCKFRVYFPPIKDIPERISVIEGRESNNWCFNDIELNDYRNNLAIDLIAYQKEYAYAQMKEGELTMASRIFQNIIEEDITDLQSLVALGLISYVKEDYSVAEDYFSLAIEYHPNNSLGFLNRAYLYQVKDKYDESLDDLTKAINIEKSPLTYWRRALLYFETKDWLKCKDDLDKVILSERYKRSAIAYTYRAICYNNLGNKTKAIKDIEIAYNLTNNPELEDFLQKLWKKVI